MIDDDFALFYGVMVGDGCISRIGNHRFVNITGNIHSDEEFINLMIPIIEKFRGKKVRAYKREKYGKIEINFSDKKLFDLLESWGFPVGKKGICLEIPIILSEKMRYVVQGYFATDGGIFITNNNGIPYPRLEFSSISKQLLEQVKEYLTSQGIKGNVYISHKQKNNWNTLFRLQINGKKNLRLFEEKIGFVNQKHHNKFKQWFKEE